MKNIASQIKALQEKHATLDEKARNAVTKEANALLRRMGVCKEITYSEFCNASVTDSNNKKDVYSLSYETLAFRTAKKFTYIVTMYTKLFEIERQLYEIEKLIKGE